MTNRLKLCAVVCTMSALLCGVGCTLSRPVTPFGRYSINVGENGTNACATIVLMDDGTVRWEKW